MRKHNRTLRCILVCLLSAIFFVSLTGCGKKEEPKDENKTPTFETIVLGHFEQDNDPSNGPEAIVWIVLEKREDGSELLLSKDALFASEYSTGKGVTSWETCAPRKWLNEVFYYEAFSAYEQEKILTSKVVDEWYRYTDTVQGNDTEDKVYLLSYNEILSFFNNDALRSLTLSQFAIANGATESSAAKENSLNRYSWWVRNPAAEVPGGMAILINDRSITQVMQLFTQADCIRPVILYKP